MTSGELDTWVRDISQTDTLPALEGLGSEIAHATEGFTKDELGMLRTCYKQQRYAIMHRGQLALPL